MEQGRIETKLQATACTGRVIASLPNRPNPQNPEGTKFCLSCGSQLLLKERYRAILLIGEGGLGCTFLAVDERQAECMLRD